MILPLTDIHLWVVFCDEVPHSATEVLSAEERERVLRFRFAPDRDRFTICRSALRHLLAHYLDQGIDAVRLRFQYGAFGKPTLAWPPASDIAFNVAHAGRVGVCAFARKRRLGVDVERIRVIPEREQIEQQYFSPLEVRWLSELQGPERERAFFDCWTRKEAYLKALGTGLSEGLDSFDVSIDPQRACLLRVRDDMSEARRWSMSTFVPAPGYVAAAAFEGRECTVSVRYYPDDLTRHSNVRLTAS